MQRRRRVEHHAFRGRTARQWLLVVHVVDTVPARSRRPGPVFLAPLDHQTRLLVVGLKFAHLPEQPSRLLPVLRAIAGQGPPRQFRQALCVRTYFVFHAQELVHEYGCFVVELSAAGTVGWADAFDDSTSADPGLGIAVDPNGTVHLVGYYKGSVDFNGSTVLTDPGTYANAFLFTLTQS